VTQLTAQEDARLIADAKRYGCEVLSVMGCAPLIKDFGWHPGDRCARHMPA